MIEENRMNHADVIRIGLIGCGMIGECHADVIERTSGVKLAAVYDLNQASAERFASKYGCKCSQSMSDLLGEVDAVAVCLPSNLHYDAVIEAARAGKHIICEKPIATKVSEAEEMIRCCEENHVILSVVFQHRFDPAVQAVKEALENGELGKILWASSRSVLYRDREYFTKTRWHAQVGSGALLNQSIHYIDLLIYLLGEPISVVGQCSSRLHVENETEDVGLAIVNFANGVPAVIEGTTAAYPGLYNELSVYGENGTFIIRNDALFSYKLKSGNKAKYDELLNPYAVYTLHRDATIDLSAHKKQYQNFVDAICGKSSLAISGEDGSRSLRLIDAIYESSKTNAMIKLD